MARYSNVNDVINRAAVECGLLKDANPTASADESFQQLTELLNGAGQEMVELHAWQTLIQPYQVTTVAGDTGTYALPDDFAYMIDQTGWERSNTRPMGGPLSPQDWAYLQGRDQVGIYASFRLAEDKFDLYPNNPVTPGWDINFQYVSRNWLQDTNGLRRDIIGTGSDTVLYDPILIIKFLKSKFLEAKGFDSTAARNEFSVLFSSRTGKDAGAPILNASGGGRREPYLNTHYSTPDTGYGF